VRHANLLVEKYGETSHHIDTIRINLVNTNYLLPVTPEKPVNVKVVASCPAPPGGLMSYGARHLSRLTESFRPNPHNLRVCGNLGHHSPIMALGLFALGKTPKVSVLKSASFQRWHENLIFHKFANPPAEQSGCFTNFCVPAHQNPDTSLRWNSSTPDQHYPVRVSQWKSEAKHGIAKR
jgi:hypothetical protein